MIKFGIPFFSALLGALVVVILTSLQSNNLQTNNTGTSADTAALIAALEQRINSLEAIAESDDLPPPGGMSDEEKVSLFKRVGLDTITIAAILSNEKEIQQLFIVAEKRRQNPVAQVQEKPCHRRRAAAAETRADAQHAEKLVVAGIDHDRIGTLRDHFVGEVQQGPGIHRRHGRQDHLHRPVGKTAGQPLLQHAGGRGVLAVGKTGRRGTALDDDTQTVIRFFGEKVAGVDTH